MRLPFLSLLLLGGLSLLAQDALSPAAGRAELRQLGAEWTTSGSFVSLTLPQPWRVADLDERGVATAFAQRFAPALGAASAFAVVPTRTQRGQDGATYVRFVQQDNFGARAQVLAGGLSIRVDADGAVSRVYGSLLSDPLLASPIESGLAGASPAAAPNATLTTDHGHRAEAIATDRYPAAGRWATTDAGLFWTSPDPLRPTAERPARLTRRYDLRETGGYRAVAVYLDVATGKEVFVQQLHCDLNRRLIHETAGNNQTVRWTEGDNYPGSLSSDDQNLLTVSAETYNLMLRTFGRDGYDGLDGRMDIIAIQSNCGNAFSNGGTISFCNGFGADDVIGHEWMHSYIGEMSNLIYFDESGAINEAYADIFGEIVDLLNTSGSDAGENTPRTGCSNGGRRWRLGEDIGGNGLRDMWSPECQNDPSSRTSARFHCADSDNRGVHINSGLVNRTFSLLVDGGSLNGVTVTGIGLTKATHIFYHAQDVYLNAASGFLELGAALTASADDLRGVNLPSLTLLDLPAPASGEVISAADVASVQAAVNATQLPGDDSCGDAPALAPNAPAPCAEAADTEYVELLGQDWENGLKNFVSLEAPENPGTWDDKPWELTDQLPGGRTGTGVFVVNSTAGNCGSDDDSGVTHLTSPPISLPAAATDFTLSFDHYFSIEDGYDGGLLYLRRNNGSYVQVPITAFVYNGYPRALVGSGGNDNPLAGREAFTGANDNSATGSWGTSVVDLAAAGARAGETIRLRWTMSHDGCTGWYGWALDDLSVGYCRSSLLPVTFLSLTATDRKDHILLDWATAAEQGNAGFYVERRTADGSAFTDLGFVAATGTEEGAYTFADRTAAAGRAYVYRLRQTDLDGSVSYSPLVSARLAADRPLLVYPNPARTTLNVRATATATEATLHDLTGRTIRRIALTDGAAELAVGGLTTGVYVLRAGGESQRVVIRR